MCRNVYSRQPWTLPVVDHHGPPRQLSSRPTCRLRSVSHLKPWPAYLPQQSAFDPPSPAVRQAHPAEASSDEPTTSVEACPVDPSASIGACPVDPSASLEACPVKPSASI